MLLTNRLLWVILLLCMATLAITSVHSLTEEISEDKSAEEFFDEGETFDYEAVDESEVDKHDFGGKTPPLPPPLPPPPAMPYPPPQVGYESPPMSYPQPQSLAYAPPPPPKYPEPAYPATHMEAYAPVPPPPPPPPMPAYQPPSYEAPKANYSQPAYQPPAPPMPAYGPPVANYSAPAYQPPAPAYQPPAPPMPAYGPPVANYSAPAYQPPAPAYQPPAPPMPVYGPPMANYSAPAYQPPTPLMPAYGPPMANYSPPAYEPPAPPTPAYQPPAPPTPAYQPPAPPTPAYQPPAPPTPAYQPPSYEAPQANYSHPAYQPPAYEPPAANYTPPAYQPPTYEAPPVMNYTQPPPSYEAPKANYTQPAYQPPPQPAYQAPPQPTYEPPKQPAYQAPPQPSYQAPPQPTYQAPPPPSPPKPTYQAPAPAPARAMNYAPPKQSYPQANQSAPAYSKPATGYAPAKPAGNYSMVVPAQSPAALAQKYSLADLAPYTNANGYRQNHWSLHYYQVHGHGMCPATKYGNGPSKQDIEQAFAYALAQLGQLRTPNYMNSSAPSFAARHQIFSFLSQQSARMDEEGLLVEFVSTYLANRMCMSKWDRQRYLPSLTRVINANQFPVSHSCSQYYQNPWQRGQTKNCYQSKYRSLDGFCNNPYHPYWGKSNICHIRLLSPDYADGISMPRESHNMRYPLPGARVVANTLNNDIPIEGPYNLMKMQWGQFINHDISNTALSSYDGLVDCCKNPQIRGCWPIAVPHGDRFYGTHNVTCLNFIRSGVCPLCQLGPRQQTNKNTAFIDASHVYGSSQEVGNQLRTFAKGQLKTTTGRQGEQLLPIAKSQDQCTGICYQAGDSRVNQHPALTTLHVLLLRNHNRHAYQLSLRHPDWNDETLFQEARRINIAEYQMITYNEYLPIVFGPILSSYFQLTPARPGQYTQFNPKVDPTTWNEYVTAACRFGHSQISSTFGLYKQILAYGHQDAKQSSFRLKEWFMRPSILADGLLTQIVNGLIGKPAMSVDPWVTTDVRNHLYQSPMEKWGGDLAATNIWRGRDHGLPGYVHYLEFCFNHKVRGWKDLQMFIPYYSLNQLRKLYKVVENIDLFSGGLAERHFPGADIGPTFACINGIQYNHLKFGDRFYFEHGGQSGSFSPAQLDEIKRATLARLVCRTASLQAAPQYAFLQPSNYNPVVNCSQIGDLDYSKF